MYALSPLFCNLEFVKTYLVHHYSTNSNRVSKPHRWTVTNLPFPLKHKTMCLLYTCCQQATFRALDPQTKPPYTQQRPAARSLWTFWGAQREGERGRRNRWSILSIMKKRLFTLNCRASSSDNTIALQVNNRYAFSQLVLVPSFSG